MAQRKKAAQPPLVLPPGRWQVIALHPLQSGRARAQPARLRNAETWEEVTVGLGQRVVGIPDEAFTGTGIFTVTRAEAQAAAQGYGVAMVEDCTMGHCWHPEAGELGEVPTIGAVQKAQRDDGLFEFGCCRCSVLECLSSPWGRRSTHRRDTR